MIQQRASSILSRRSSLNFPATIVLTWADRPSMLLSTRFTTRSRQREMCNPSQHQTFFGAVRKAFGRSGILRAKLSALLIFSSPDRERITSRMPVMPLRPSPALFWRPLLPNLSATPETALQAFPPWLSLPQTSGPLVTLETSPEVSIQSGNFRQLATRSATTRMSQPASLL
jgi:hypothetical protein